MNDKNITPLAPSDSGWQRCAFTLCAKEGVEAEIAGLAREGWELEFITTPHYGRLLLIGHFRRREVSVVDIAKSQGNRTRAVPKSAT